MRGFQRAIGALERSLREGGRDYLAAERFTVADLNVASNLAWGQQLGWQAFEPYPHVAAWLRRCLFDRETSFCFRHKIPDYGGPCGPLVCRTQPTANCSLWAVHIPVVQYAFSGQYGVHRSAQAWKSPIVVSMPPGIVRCALPACARQRDVQRSVAHVSGARTAAGGAPLTPGGPELAQDASTAATCQQLNATKMASASSCMSSRHHRTANNQPCCAKPTAGAVPRVMGSWVGGGGSCVY